MDQWNPGAAVSRLLAVFLFLIGALIAAGGTYLTILGGTIYYMVGGAAVILAAILIWRRDGRGAVVYAAFLAATLAWALWEAGLDGWALAPRLIGPAFLGLLFALPWVRRWIGRVAFVPVAMAVLLLLVQIGVPVFGSSDHVVATSSSAPLGSVPAAGTAAEWPVWGGTNAGQRFSRLEEITPTNVHDLKLAWTYHTGADLTNWKGPLETTPLMVGDTLYLCGQRNVVIALDPDSGKEKWRFDPKIDETGKTAVTTCRGVAFYAAGGASDCPERIIAATFNAQLIALDAHTGLPCTSFGEGGVVDLTRGMGLVQKGYYYVSSAPLVARGNIVLGGYVADNMSTDEPSGVVRAFDATTGQLAWAWDVGRPDDRSEPPPGQHYTRSSPNSWAPMSADETLGLIYVPTGGATPDHWGGHRSPSDEQFGSSVVALDAATGALRWHFQTTHHDLWDYDVGSQPTLVDLVVGDSTVPALIQATKRGEIFVLDRRTGVPLTPVEEQPAPQRGAAPGDRISKTQPFSVGMPSFGGQTLTEKDMWGLTPIDQLWCRIHFKQLRYDGTLTPPGEDESLIYPGIAGGMNWGGISVDPERGLMIVNSIYYGTTVHLLSREETDRRLAATEGQMHSFNIPQPQTGTPYGVVLTGFASALNVPCNKPPFGKLSAVDLRTRKLVWSQPIGSARDSGPMGLASHLPITMGLPMLGGSLVTKSGLVFIGATQERAFRAYDVQSGRELWRVALPAGGQANPMTYISPKSGRQFVVIAAGGYSLLQSPQGDSIVAYALQ